MASGWAIVQGGTTVTLTHAPDDYDDDLDGQIDEHHVDGSGTTLISRFLNPNILTIQGIIMVKGQSHATFLSTYKNPLKAMVRKEVTITSPDSEFPGNWLLCKINFHKSKSTPVEGAVECIYTFTAIFKQGSSNVVE